MKKQTKSQRKLGLKIKEIMTREVVTIHPDATVDEAAQQMSRHDVGMLPVFEGGQMLGVFTDRDITIRVVSEGRDPRKTRVRDIMTPEIIYCYDHEDVNEAVKSFEKMQIRRVPVLNRKKQLVGVLSLGDLAVDSGDKMLVGHVLKKVSEPERLRL